MVVEATQDLAHPEALVGRHPNVKRDRKAAKEEVTPQPSVI